MKRISRLICSMTVMALAMSATSLLHAEDKPTPEMIIKHRQAVMMAIGGHTGATFGSMNLPEFAGQQLYHLEQINHLAKISAKTFPPGSADGKTKTKPEAWSKPEEFKKLMDDFLLKAQKAVDQGKKSTTEKEYLAAVKELTETCKACHKKFKEE